MEKSAKDIIAIYLKRISLFQDLLNCIVLEREHLITQNIKGIWSSLEEKQSIMDSIEETKSQLGGASCNEIALGDFSSEDRNKIMELSRAIVLLKCDIQARVKENVSFINETLDFFDEMISTMTMTQADTCRSYGPSGNSMRGPRSQIYQGEA